MIRIQLPKETINSLLNGASKFILPIRVQGFTRLEINEYEELTCSNCGHIVDSDPKHICNYCEGSMCYENIPLKIGDKFFIQEDFTEIGFNKIKTKNEIPNNQWYIYDWIDASQMKLSQSRYTNTSLNIELKRVHDITYIERCDMKLPKDGAYWQKDVENWYNNQYNNYEENPYCWIITVKV